MESGHFMDIPVHGVWILDHKNSRNLDGKSQKWKEGLHPGKGQRKDPSEDYLRHSLNFITSSDFIAFILLSVAFQHLFNKPLSGLNSSFVLW